MTDNVPPPPGVSEPAAASGARRYDAVIIGAGIAGLTIGDRLAQRGRACLILEQAPQAGGLARTFQADGFTFDIGPHFVFADGIPESVAFLKELLGGRWYEVPLRFGYHFAGRYFPWPPGLGTLRHYPPGVFWYHLLRPLLARKPADESYEQELRTQHGPYLYARFFGPYLAKKLGGADGRTVHRDWWLKPPSGVWGRRPPLPPGHLLHTFRVLLRNLTSTQRLYYPRGGYEDLIRALLQRFTAAGGEVRYGVRDIRAVARTDGAIERVIADGVPVAVRALVSTASLDFTAALLGMPRPAGLRYAPLIVALLQLKRPLRACQTLYQYFADPDLVFNRLYFPTAISRDLAPPGKDALCVELTPARDAPEPDPDVLRRRVCDDLARAGVCDVADIEVVRFERFPTAMPIYPLDYRARLQTYYDAIRARGNVWVAGRTGTFSMVLTDGTVMNALETARDIERVWGQGP